MTLFRATALLLLLSSLSFIGAARASHLPGFRVETLAMVPGFATSIVADSAGAVYVSTSDGWIHRVGRDGSAARVAALPSKAGGNGGLLGMALLSDATAVVHYTTRNAAGSLVLADVISLVDLASGAESPLRAFDCNSDFPANGCSDEHHGGNPAVAPDGSIFVGLGDYGGRTLAQKPDWNGGKIWKLDLDGNATLWASGLRNPYDLAWDPALGAVVASDNGSNAGDEINVVPSGANLGWPNTMGNEPPMTGATPPVYVFPSTVAPTGLHRLSGANPALPGGYLSAAFVTRAIYYFPAVTSPSTPAPHALLDGFPSFVIDVTEDAAGDVLFVSAWGDGSEVHRLVPPARGDCNGDGLVDAHDLFPLMSEVAEGEHSAFLAHEGTFAGSWGCDANGDHTITAEDLDALRGLLPKKRRAAR